MRGQWTGTYRGENVEGDMLVNVDEVGDHFECEVYIAPFDGDIPASIGYAVTSDKGHQHRVNVIVNPFDPRSAQQTKWDLIKHLYPDSVLHNAELDVDISLYGGNLSLQSVESPDRFSGVASRFYAPDQSKIRADVLGWREFKNYLSDFADSNFLFRGQAQDWPLRTSFHRRERYRINQFINTDVRTLHRRLSGLTGHFFDLTVPDQNGAFLNLLQHHGYPTPLLDWSYSPYVAAFFAFRDVKKNSKEEGHIRIFLFDAEAWKSDFNQLTQLVLPRPHLSVMEFLSVNNPRQSPQQAVTKVDPIFQTIV